MKDNRAVIEMNLFYCAEHGIEIGVHYPGPSYIDFLIGRLEVMSSNIEHFSIRKGRVKQLKTEPIFIIRPRFKKLPTLKFPLSNVGSFSISRKEKGWAGQCATSFCMGDNYTRIEP